jgi:hypothetical protein
MLRLKLLLEIIRYGIWSLDVIWVFELCGKEKGRILEWVESSSGFVLEI